MERRHPAAVMNIGQVFPPLAVLAVAVPLVAYGTTKTLMAVVHYGLLPIFESTVTGLTKVPPAVTEPARGVSMSDRRRLMVVELPLALPAMMLDGAFAVVERAAPRSGDRA